MSMTESEAIRRLKDHFRVHDDGRPTPYLDEAVSMAISTLEEVQRYRENREIFENQFSNDVLKLLSDKEEFAKWLERGRWLAKKCDELGREVEEYRAIGTVSEFRELKEKATAKKVKERQCWKCEHEECAPGCESDFDRCPNCNEVLDNDCGEQYKFCPDCGQQLLWT